MLSKETPTSCNETSAWNKDYFLGIIALQTNASWHHLWRSLECSQNPCRRNQSLISPVFVDFTGDNSFITCSDRITIHGLRATAELHSSLLTICTTVYVFEGKAQLADRRQSPGLCCANKHTIEMSINTMNKQSFLLISITLHQSSQA